VGIKNFNFEIQNTGEIKAHQREWLDKVDGAGGGAGGRPSEGPSGWPLRPTVGHFAWQSGCGWLVRLAVEVAEGQADGRGVGRPDAGQLCIRGNRSYKYKT
jgi:hypothetical protein